MEVNSFIKHSSLFYKHFFHHLGSPDEFSFKPKLCNIDFPS